MPIKVRYADLELRQKDGRFGQLGQPLIEEWLDVPDDIQLADDRLTWDFRRGSLVPPPKNLLPSFLKIRTPRAVLRFARKYGVFGARIIGSDAHRRDNEIRLQQDLETPIRDDLDLPRWEVSRNRTWRPDEIPWPRGPVRNWEPLCFWTAFADAARAMLNISLALTRDPATVGEDQDWDALGPFHEHSSLEAARTSITSTLHMWLRAGRVGIRAVPKRGLGDGPTVWQTYISYGAIDEFSLFGHLAAQLMLAVANADGILSCTGCKNLYLRPMGKRRPRPGQNSYCEECRGKSGKDTARKDAKRRYRAKVADARRRYSAGSSVEELADILRPRGGVEAIKRWVGLG